MIGVSTAAAVTIEKLRRVKLAMFHSQTATYYRVGWVNVYSDILFGKGFKVKLI